MTLHFLDSDEAIDITKSLKATPVVVDVPKKPGYSYPRFAKRILDILLVLIAAPLVLPIVALMALVIATDGHNPFYAQKRIGKNGRVFWMWKLRTMVHNADDMLQRYLDENPEAKREWDLKQKLKNDPRITRVGSILRKTSLDELPQLFNVLKGSMSLVGPRPMMVNQRSMYFGTSYYHLRPGVTGLWQISERNNCQFEDRVIFDDEYYRTVSFKTDVVVILRTVLVVLRGTGC